MSIVSTKRTSSPDVGSARFPSKREASEQEVNAINRAITELSRAKKQRNHAGLVNNLTEAYRIVRNLSRSRLL